MFAALCMLHSKAQSKDLIINILEKLHSVCLWMKEIITILMGNLRCYSRKHAIDTDQLAECGLLLFHSR